MLHTEDNFHEVQTTKCAKTLYQTDTILHKAYTVPTSHSEYLVRNQVNSALQTCSSQKVKQII